MKKNIKIWHGKFADKKEVKRGTISRIYRLEKINGTKVVEVFEFQKTKSYVNCYDKTCYEKVYYLTNIIYEKDFKYNSMVEISFMIDNWWSDDEYIILSEENYIEKYQDILKHIKDYCKQKMQDKCLLEDGTSIPSSHAKFAERLYDFIRPITIH